MSKAQDLIALTEKIMEGAAGKLGALATIGSGIGIAHKHLSKGGEVKKQAGNALRTAAKNATSKMSTANSDSAREVMKHLGIHSG